MATCRITTDVLCRCALQDLACSSSSPEKFLPCSCAAMGQACISQARRSSAEISLAGFAFATGCTAPGGPGRSGNWAQEPRVTSAGSSAVARCQPTAQLAGALHTLPEACKGVLHPGSGPRAQSEEASEGKSESW